MRGILDKNDEEEWVDEVVELAVRAVLSLLVLLLSSLSSCFETASFSAYA